MVRVALQALAAVLGGCQSLHTNRRDEALALPTEDARAARAAHPADHRLRDAASRDIVDPLGGSYAVEALTDELEAKAEAYMRKIDEMGGMVEAISLQGYPQEEIQDAAYAAQRDWRRRAGGGGREQVRQTKGAALRDCCAWTRRVERSRSSG